ncbi:MAG: hypothetical protein HN341_18665, partial [Verrucomicrobia bacterium]|nr:hypothetical protein [Verrucomicrobiota bacterium]
MKLNRREYISGAAASAGVLFLLLTGGLCAFAGKAPNVIIVVTDDHGYADFGAYGLSDDIR